MENFSDRKPVREICGKVFARFKGFRREQTHEISNFHWKSGFYIHQKE